MPNRALAAAFGGIADFLKLNRGLHNETADRVQKAQAHDAALKASDVATRAGEENILGMKDERLYRPRERGLREATQFYTLGGAKAAEASLNSPTSAFSGDPNLAGLNLALRQRDEAERVERETGAARRDLTVGQVKSQDRTLTAQAQMDQLIANGEFQPFTNPTHAQIAVNAGKPEMNRPTYTMTRDDAREDQRVNRDFVASQSALARGAAVELAKLNINANSLQGSSPAIDDQIKVQMAPLIQAANSIQANVQADELKIAQLQAQKDANIKQFNGVQAAMPANGLLDRQIARIRNGQLVKVGEAYAAADGVVQLFSSTPGIDPTLVLPRVNALIKTSTAGLGARPTPEQLKAAAAALAVPEATGVPDPTKKGTVSIIPGQRPGRD